MKKLLIAVLALSIPCTGAFAGKKKAKCSTVTVDGHTYTTDPCSIEIEMVHGKGDKQFTFSIVPDDFIHYGFSVHGYGFGFPTYGMISNVSSGGARGTQYITVNVHDQYLPLDNNGKTKKYSGYVPIHIYQGSETGRDTNFIKLPITITVKEK